MYEFFDQKIEKIKERILNYKINNDNDLVIHRGPTNLDFLNLFIQKHGSEEKLLDFEDIYKRKGDRKINFSENETEDDFTCWEERGEISVPVKQLSDPKQIFMLLHEIGHISYYDKTGITASIEEYPALFGAEKPTQEIAGKIMKRERGAWAEAIKLAGQIKNKYSIDLFKLFENNNEFKKWIRANSLNSFTKESMIKSIEKQFEKESEADH